MLHTLRQGITKATNKWLFQLRDAEPGEAFLNQRRVFILPTGPGLGLGLMLIILFIGAINYNLSLGFALTFLLAGCAVIDMHLTFRNLAHLHLSAGRVPAVFAGEEAQFELHLINRRKHDRYAIWVGFIGKDMPGLEQAADVPAQGSSRIVLSAPARRRGSLPAPQVRLQTRFPLGLLRAWSYWQPDAKALVYPQPEQSPPPLPMSAEAHEEGQGHAGHDDFAGIRAYQVGDSMKRLAWRQIARLDIDAGGTLISKHFEGGANSELLLDMSALPRNMDVELKLSRLTSWVIEAETRGVPYALRLGHVAFPAAIGPAHQEACLRSLALYEGS
jgi:uncharacterized protein (DUF58 family)